MAGEQNAVITLYPTCMVSVNRITKFPVIESTFQTATNIYEKVKVYNSITNWTFSTAENTAKKAIAVGIPIVTPVFQKLEDPIKKVDNVLCSGLDYVEAKVPAVKLPPSELLLQMYNHTIEYVTPAVETAKSYAEPAYKNLVEPTVEKTKSIVEPMVEKTMSIVEPFVHPAIEKAQQIKETVMHKVDEYMHRGHECTGNPEECAGCQQQQQEQSNQGQEERREEDHHHHHHHHEEHHHY